MIFIIAGIRRPKMTGNGNDFEDYDDYGEHEYQALTGS